MSAVALFLQQFVIHSAYRHTEEKGNEIFVVPSSRICFKDKSMLRNKAVNLLK